VDSTQKSGPSTTPLSRVGFYIDGYNVYHGLRHKGFRRFYWLDYRRLAETFLRPGQVLVHVKYFTSRVTGPPATQKRQSTYLDALRVTGGIEIVEGKYQSRPVRCPECRYGWKRPTEKMTDVSIATHLVSDAIRDVIDVAALICADADLVPAVRLAKEEGKHVIIVSPRGRTSDELAREGDAHLHVSNATLGRCQLPDAVDGGLVPLKRPDEWH
jgi:uncharacterized LabA/DUF88 family protein